MFFCVLYLHLGTVFSLIWKREEGITEGREGSIDWFPPVRAWMAADWGLYTQPFGYGTSPQPTEPRWTGLGCPLSTPLTSVFSKGKKVVHYRSPSAPLPNGALYLAQGKCSVTDPLTNASSRTPKGGDDGRQEVPCPMATLLSLGDDMDGRQVSLGLLLALGHASNLQAQSFGF